ncbi:MAG: zinc ribbon domain-containing protein [Anaerolineae bacterium]|nr:zinc ribbon domain-containing protein [Anaerolineae bacterium]
MPVYTYRREDGTTFDIRQSFQDQTLATCPTTGQKVTRVVQNAGVIFKGSGFYVNDSKSASKQSLNSGNGSKDTATESTKDTSAPSSESTPAPAPAKETTPAPTASPASNAAV